MYEKAIKEAKNIIENPTSKYQRLWGEQQARAAEYRKDMTPEQRVKESWQQTLERVEGGSMKSLSSSVMMVLL